MALPFLLRLAGLAGTGWWADQEFNDGRATEAVINSGRHAAERTAEEVRSAAGDFADTQARNTLEEFGIEPDSRFGETLRSALPRIIGLGGLAAILPSGWRAPALKLGIAAIVVMGFLDHFSNDVRNEFNTVADNTEQVEPRRVPDVVVSGLDTDDPAFVRQSGDIAVDLAHGRPVLDAPENDAG